MLRHAGAFSETSETKPRRQPRHCGVRTIGTSLCLNNAVGVLQACLRRKSAFTRTPKSGSTFAAGRRNRYAADRSMTTAAVELALALYCMVTLAVYLVAAEWIFGAFIAACAIGLAVSGTAYVVTAPNQASR